VIVDRKGTKEKIRETCVSFPFQLTSRWNGIILDLAKHLIGKYFGSVPGTLYKAPAISLVWLPKIIVEDGSFLAFSLGCVRKRCQPLASLSSFLKIREK